MNPGRRFTPATPNIAHESFDEEVVVVNLMSGKYYALKGEGADIWRLAMAGADFQAICGGIGRSYAGEPAVIEAGIRSLLDRLLHEGLIAATDAPAESAAAPPPPVRGVPFQTPVLQVHEDLQDLLLLDPIHEVDGAGWPVMKREQGQDVP